MCLLLRDVKKWVKGGIEEVRLFYKIINIELCGIICIMYVDIYFDSKLQLLCDKFFFKLIIRRIESLYYSDVEFENVIQINGQKCFYGCGDEIVFYVDGE